MKKEFTISLEIPEGVTSSEMKNYILDAVSSMKGCKHPEDPIFYLDSKKIKVRSKKNQRISPQIINPIVAGGF